MDGFLLLYYAVIVKYVALIYIIFIIIVWFLCIFIDLLWFTTLYFILMDLLLDFYLFKSSPNFLFWLLSLLALLFIVTVTTVIKIRYVNWGLSFIIQTIIIFRVWIAFLFLLEPIIIDKFIEYIYILILFGVVLLCPTFLFLLNYLFIEVSFFPNLSNFFLLLLHIFIHLSV